MGANKREGLVLYYFLEQYYIAHPEYRKMTEIQFYCQKLGIEESDYEPVIAGQKDISEKGLCSALHTLGMTKEDFQFYVAHLELEPY